MKDKIIVCDDVKATVMEYISKRFDRIIPFEVHPGYNFQIRVNRPDYEKLAKSYKEQLTKHSKSPESIIPDDIQESKIYETTHYWKRCDCYIFNFDMEFPIILNTKCEYGYEGREESEDIIFIPREYPAIIMDNIGLNERDHIKLPEK
jgi:hypothetical protein